MFDKITSRISKLCYGLNDDFIEPVSYISLSLSLSPPPCPSHYSLIIHLLCSG